VIFGNALSRNNVAPAKSVRQKALLPSLLRRIIWPNGYTSRDEINRNFVFTRSAEGLNRPPFGRL